MSRRLPFSLVCLTGLFWSEPLIGKENKPQTQENPQFVGAASCSSSSCHGGAGEKRSQYSIWSRSDFHSRAYSILLDARSARIAEALRLPSAQLNARCTVCHSPFQSVAQERLGPSAHPDEGVSCESCHGAAGPWLRGHTRSDWTYDTRVNAGMRDLRNLYLRANACVACHQNIDNDILEAGHPALVFELDSQSIHQPRHWKETDPWIGVQSWLTGQAVALREMSWALQTQSPNRTSSDLLTRWRGLVALLDETEFLARETAAEPRLAVLKSPGAVQQRVDAIARTAARMNWTPDLVRQLAFQISSKAPDNADTATRLLLGLESFTRSLAANGGPELPVENELSTLRNDVRNSYDFEAGRFGQDLQAFQKKLR